MPMVLQRARFLLSRERPWINAALFSIKLAERKGLGTMAASQDWVVYYDPETIERWGEEATASVLYHEIWHLLRQHHDRLRTFPQEVANVAADLEINDDADEMLLELPSPLLPEQFGLEKGKLAEEYAKELMKDPERVTSVLSGSAANGRTQPWETEKGLSKSRGEAIRRHVAVEIQRQKGRGNLPGEAIRWAEEVLSPKVDWRRELLSVVATYVAMGRGANDYTYSRPQRRNPDPDVFLPRLVGPKVPVAVVIDTSGSISDEELAQAVTETVSIIRTVGDSVHVFSCDAGVTYHGRLSSVHGLRLVGGGGTDMTEGIKAALDLRPRPAVIVVITDCLTPWPDEPPPVPVIVCRLGEEGEVPEWAKEVRCVGHIQGRGIASISGP